MGLDVRAAMKRLLCEVLSYAGDHGWVLVYADKRVKLIDGTFAAGTLMTRVHKGREEYRHLTPEEEIAEIREA